MVSPRPRGPAPGRPSRPLPHCPPRARAAVASLTPGRSEPWMAQAAAATAPGSSRDVGWDDTGRWDLAGLADLEHCEAFLPNAEEAMRYTRTDCPRAAAHALAEHVPLAVVTLGAEGAYAVDGRTGETRRGARPSRSRPWTPPGAGDVFVAGFVTGTLAGWPLADRLAFAGPDRRALRPGVRRLALRARLVGDRRLVAQVQSSTTRTRRPCGGTRSWRTCCPRGRPAPGRCAGRCPTIGFGRRPERAVQAGHAGPTCRPRARDRKSPRRCQCRVVRWESQRLPVWRACPATRRYVQAYRAGP